MKIRDYMEKYAGNTPAYIRDRVLEDHPEMDSQKVRHHIKVSMDRKWYKKLAIGKIPKPRDLKAEIIDALPVGLVYRDSELRIHLNIHLDDWTVLRAHPSLEEYRLQVNNGPRKGLWWANPVSISTIRERCDIL